MEPSTEDNRCRRYCCSTFHRFEDTAVLKSATLTNSILPLFARKHYRPEIDYSVLEPCLRLATQLLASGGAASYIVTMVDGDLHLVDGVARGRRVEWEEIDAMRDVNGQVMFPRLARYPRAEDMHDFSQIRGRAREILDNLVGMIDLDFANLPQDVRGFSKALEGPLVRDVICHWPRGVRSRISTSASVYIEMLKLTERQKQGHLSNKELERLLLVQFSYATTLVHEIGHALLCAVQGSIHRGEPFLGDEEVAEAGYALEAAIFGGLLDGNITMTTRQYAKDHGLCPQAKKRVKEGKYVKNALTLIKWPSGIYQHSYQTGHAMMGSRKDLSPYDEIARVPLAFIGDLFSAEFWRKDAARCTLGPLVVPQQGYWITGVDTMIERQFVCDVDDNCLERSIRDRLISIIEADAIEYPIGEPGSCMRVTGFENKEPSKVALIDLGGQSPSKDLHRSKRLVTVFGDEMRQVVQTTAQGHMTVVLSRQCSHKSAGKSGGLSRWMNAWYR